MPNDIDLFSKFVKPKKSKWDGVKEAFLSDLDKTIVGIQANSGGPFVTAGKKLGEATFAFKLGKQKVPNRFLKADEEYIVTPELANTLAKIRQDEKLLNDLLADVKKFQDKREADAAKRVAGKKK